MANSAPEHPISKHVTVDFARAFLNTIPPPKEDAKTKGGSKYKNHNHKRNEEYGRTNPIRLQWGQDAAGNRVFFGCKRNHAKVTKGYTEPVSELKAGHMKEAREQAREDVEMDDKLTCVIVEAPTPWRRWMRARTSTGLERGTVNNMTPAELRVSCARMKNPACPLPDKWSARRTTLAIDDDKRASIVECLKVVVRTGLPLFPTLYGPGGRLHETPACYRCVRFTDGGNDNAWRVWQLCGECADIYS
jgi:hypothetical protein